MSISKDFNDSTVGVGPQVNSFWRCRFTKSCTTYWKKWRGAATTWPPIWKLPSLIRLISAFIGSFIAMAVLGVVQRSSVYVGFVGIMYSMGATAVLVYAAPEAPFSQPRNVVFGHFFAALLAIGWRYAWPPTSQLNWLSGALSVSTSIFVMQITDTLHPPAGATALFISTSPDSIVELTAHSFLILAFPVLGGIAFMILIALVVNNFFLEYPITWT
jgi:CBS-domain-containing membrane protein